MPLPLEQQTNATFKVFLFKCVTLLQSIKNVMFDLEVETERGALLSSPSCGSPALVITCNCCSCGTRAGRQAVRAAQLSLLPWRRETWSLQRKWVCSKLSGEQ